MATPKQLYYEKRAQLLVKNLKSRHFDAYYCPTQKEALEKALELIPAGSSIGWGGAASAQQIGLLDAVKKGDYCAIDRDTCKTPEEREQAAKACLNCDVFVMGANGLSMDGQLVSIDGIGNRVAALIYGPKKVLIIAGMNKVEEDLDAALRRARTVAAPMNQQRFLLDNPCTKTGTCTDCKSDSCICNQIVITRNCHPAGRIQFVLVGEELGF